MNEFETEFHRQLRDRLERNVDAALSQQIFNIAKAERTPVIKPHRMRDDLDGKAVAFIANGQGFYNIKASENGIGDSGRLWGWVERFLPGARWRLAAVDIFGQHAIFPNRRNAPVSHSFPVASAISSTRK